MKRACLLIWGVLFTSIAWSQSMNIHYKNGQTVQYNMNNIDYVEYTEDNPNNAQVSSGEAIDLGLSVKWASCNIGASSPEIFGDRYAWGETNTKETYSTSTYIYYDSNTSTYIDIGKDIGGTNYDVAHVKWGGRWRMPTFYETDELRKKCSLKWSKLNGVTGYIVTGPNGNSIFLPVNGRTYYWASDMYKYEEKKASNTLSNAHCMEFDSSGANNIISSARRNGYYIRPIMPY